MKILISAYSCEPGKGSERGVGWNVVWEAAKYNEVWVLTRPDESKEAIEAELASNPNPNLHFVYFTLPILGGLWRLGSNGAMQIHYYLWQIQAYFVARRLHRQIGFDVAHHVTFVKYSNPSFLSLLPIPFIWGPVGGGETAPKAFWRDFDFRAKAYEAARIISRSLGELDPFVHITARKSAVVRATTEDTAKKLYKMGVKSVDLISESGLLTEEISVLNQYPIPTQQPVRFISMGRLLHWKGFHLGLQAFAKANLTEAEYWIVGDGPEWERLQSMATQLGIAHKVKFWGRLPREKTLENLGNCHVLVHPSLHDSGGWVCIEAMATGRPVVCLDLGGPAQQVTAETGFKIAAINPEQAVDDMSKALITLAKDPELRVRMGQAGRQLVRDTYSWQVMGQRLAQVYEEVISFQKPKVLN
ncbi:MULTISPECIES: glycosyltransferase family 4 protein [unclassified Tolypothrix]|uniref:glycosyltransferase family 4 protein n=1 Tax=unclassified Tolypothrix TaxID=2649714 RepID=UPI0005EAA359|nr:MULTISPECIES: glycosyltransferase [unclassified Tolypothrix]BAY91934.1 group 1 glycosyl transferase [Microchaete diplosiphon NIES-3275]EKF04889.1 glycosyltransferase, group 1 family [Tolypothrix sp. PCC 7601]MBE9082714.1 glycosyltransferase [Tolypothrix sp. LEGE 11397]UYD25933.1 glycosyltransferase [Tolypothrix sp. PCC 7712]UYD31828.1 glycosyltransferase [Tolypothrix sp. PCC 7601]